MKILAISHLFPHRNEPRYGIFVARQLAAMNKLGARITVFVPRVWCPGALRRFERWRGQNYAAPLCKFEGIETVAVPYLRPPGNWYNRWSGLAVFLASRKRIRELHKKEGFDVIYATDLFPDGDAAVRLARYLKIPAACLCIGVDVNLTAHSSKTMHKHFVRTAQSLDGTLACGQSVAAEIRSVTGKKSLCVYGVLDLEEFSPVPDNMRLRKELNLPSDKIVALFAGYLAQRKGVYELVEVFDRVGKGRSDLMLVMCGAGSEDARLRGLIRARGLENVIYMAGE